MFIAFPLGLLGTVVGLDGFYLAGRFCGMPVDSGSRADAVASRGAKPGLQANGLSAYALLSTETGGKQHSQRNNYCLLQTALLYYVLRFHFSNACE